MDWCHRKASAIHPLCITIRHLWTTFQSGRCKPFKDQRSIKERCSAIYFPKQWNVGIRHNHFRLYVSYTCDTLTRTITTGRVNYIYDCIIHTLYFFVYRICVENVEPRSKQPYMATMGPKDNVDVFPSENPKTDDTV